MNDKPLLWDHIRREFPEWEEGYDYSLCYGNLMLALDERGDWAMSMHNRREYLCRRIDPFNRKSIQRAKAAASQYFNEEYSRNSRLYPYSTR